MDLKRLIEVADKAYDADGIILSYFEEPEVDHGDGLARFICLGLKDTYAADASDEEQLAEAVRVMCMAHDQLGRVINALEEL